MVKKEIGYGSIIDEIFFLSFCPGELCLKLWNIGSLVRIIIYSTFLA